MSFISRILAWLKVVVSRGEKTETATARELREVNRLGQNLIVMQLSR